ncbi:MAG: protoporphyrinogen oxidase [Tetrasphaera sp.]
MHRIVIVGGGMAGLTAAVDLLASSAGTDLDVTVLEATDRPGGKLRQETIAGHLADVGAEAMLGLRPEARDLIEQIGAVDQIVTPATMAASIYSYGALHPMPPRSLMGIPNSPDDARGILSPEDLARLAAPVQQPPIDGDASVGDYVAATLGDAVVDRLVDPLLGGVYAGSARDLSLAATLPMLYPRALAGEPLLGAGAGAAPARPASRTAGSPAPPPAFIGLRGGVGRFPDLLQEAIEQRGGTVRTGVTVRELRRTDRGTWSLTTGSTTDPATVEADAVILATPVAPTRRLIADLAPAAAEQLAGIESASMVVATFAFPAADMPPLDGSGFLVPPVEGRFVKASTFSSSKWGWLPQLAPEVVYVRASFGRHGEEAALQRPDDELLHAALADLTGILDLALPDPIDTHIQRWGGGLPQYAVGHLDRIALVRKAISEVERLEVAGAAYDGVGIPAVIGSGRRAAGVIRAQLGLPD